MTLPRIRPEQAQALAGGADSPCAPCRRGPRPATEPGPVLPHEDATTWIGIRLEDAGGRPVPDQDFEIALDGGRVLSGRTDAEGRARFDGVPVDQGMAAFAGIPEQDPDHEGRS